MYNRLGSKLFTAVTLGDGMREQVLELLASEGILLEPDAANFVLGKEDPLSYCHAALGSMKQQPLVITMEDLRGVNDILGVVVAENRSMTEVMEVISQMPPTSTYSSDTDVKVTRDITGNSSCEGNIIDFARYFNDRFKKIKKMLVHRRELAGCVSVARATKLGREVRTIAIVNEVRTTKNGHRMLEVEDEEGRCPVLILKDSPLIHEQIVPDEVIGIVGKASKKGDMIVMDELVRPDVPLHGSFEMTDSSTWVGFMSDIHVGSNTFLEKQWQNMIKWINTEGKHDIGYLVIPGDVVDGIGVFPGQEEELEIDDIFRQYEVLSEHLKEIPDSIKLIMQPGNHDAVRPAEPQPTFPKDISKLFDSHVRFVGNPCNLEIEGRKIFSYHGRSLDDWIGSVQTLTYNNPLDAMKEMLKRRHVAPLYGGKTPLAPEKEDYLVDSRRSLTYS